MNLDRYHQMHSEIHAQASELRGRLRAPGASFDAAAARQSFVTLAAKLNIHLAFEDRALYPPLLDHVDPTVRTKAKAYLGEVGGLKASLSTHLERWLSSTKVQEEPEVFRRETADLMDALDRRLEAEDGDFYPTLERLA